MSGLPSVFVEKLLRMVVVAASMVLPIAIALAAGRYLGKFWNIDEDLLIGGSFFLVLALQSFGYGLVRALWRSRARP
jgi:hypothetical protein